MNAIVVGTARTPVLDQWFGEIPVRAAARGKRLADTGGAEAQADVAMLAHGASEFDEAAVLLGRDEQALAHAGG